MVLSTIKIPVFPFPFGQHKQWQLNSKKEVDDHLKLYLDSLQTVIVAVPSFYSGLSNNSSLVSKYAALSISTGYTAFNCCAHIFEPRSTPHQEIYK